MFRSPQLRPDRVLEEWRRGLPPVPPHAYMRADRYFPQDFSRFGNRPWSPDTGYEGMEYPGVENDGTPADPAELAAMLDQIEVGVRRIQGRGGNVLFLHLPACGPRQIIEERRYPRAEYWDRLADHTSGVAIHAGDYPTLSDFPCYDGSHLNAADAPAFTRSLAALATQLIP